MSGFVSLVGAGPGAVQLFTLGGRAALKAAQVVIYDRLVSDEILALIPPGAKRIDVGKSAGYHPIPQGEINAILLREAQSDQRVVRLKGGDPFLFGRGGEELELLLEKGISVEVIPGVPSAIAVPAYGGIPVTHRDCSSALHILTGHPKAGAETDINYKALVQAGGTLVFLMGLSALREICQGLLQAGMAPDTPAALVERGTTPRQRRVLATVDSLWQQGSLAEIRSPALVVVGEVCRYGESLDWFSSLQKRKKTVILTRPQKRMEALAESLRAMGYGVVEYPCITTRPCLHTPEVKRAIQELSDYSWLVFTSPQGVELLPGALLEHGRDLRAVAQLKLAALGPGTAGALERLGLRADLMPEVYDTRHLGQLLCQQAQGRLLLFRSAQGNPLLPQLLQAGGLAHDDVACYCTEYSRPNPAPVLKALEQGGACVCFTSGSTVRGFVKSLPPGTEYSSLLACCIGEETAAVAKEYGFSCQVAEQATPQSLLQLMKTLV